MSSISINPPKPCKTWFASAKYKINKFVFNNSRKSVTKNLLISVLVILLSLVVSLLIAAAVYRDGKLITQITKLVFTIPFTSIWKDTVVSISIFAVSALSFIFAQKAGLFNIGISGQMLAGAQVATMMSWFLAKSPNVIGQVIGLLSSMIVAGAIAALIGWLKIRFNVNEVISSIMINWIIYFLGIYVLYAVANKMGQIDANTGLNTTILASNFYLGIDSTNNIVSGAWLPLAIIGVTCIIGSIVVLNLSKFGKDIKFVGINSFAASYAGINVNRNKILSMLISGMLAGVLGVMIYCGQKQQMDISITSKVIPQNGFYGISVGLIAMNNPIGVLPASLLFGMISNSKSAIQQQLGVDPYFTDLMFGIIVYGAAIIVAFYCFQPWIWFKQLIYGKNAKNSYNYYVNSTQTLIYKTDEILSYLNKTKQWAKAYAKLKKLSQQFAKNKNASCEQALKQMDKIKKLKDKINELYKAIDPDKQLQTIPKTLRFYSINLDKLKSLKKINYAKYAMIKVYFNNQKIYRTNYKQYRSYSRNVDLKLTKSVNKNHFEHCNELIECFDTFRKSAIVKYEGIIEDASTKDVRVEEIQKYTTNVANKVRLISNRAIEKNDNWYKKESGDSFRIIKKLDAAILKAVEAKKAELLTEKKKVNKHIKQLMKKHNKEERLLKKSKKDFNKLYKQCYKFAAISVERKQLMTNPGKYAHNIRKGAWF